MKQEMALNILAALDGRDVLTNDSIRTCNALGAEGTHAQMSATLIAMGWARGYKNKTNVDMLTTPWLFKWKQRTRGEQQAFEALVASKPRVQKKEKEVEVIEPITEVEENK